MAPRRSLELTRRDLLDAGAALLAEQGMPVGLDQLSMMDVCRRAGLKTAGSAYKIWDTQEAFRNDLLHYLLVPTSATVATAARVDDLGALGPDSIAFDDLIRIAAETNMESIQGSYPTYVLVLLARLHRRDLATAAEGPESEWLAALVGLITKAMDAYDLSFVPPFDVEVLAVSLSALAEGLTIRKRVTPELVPDAVEISGGEDGAKQSWSMLALGMKAIFDAFTCPRESATNE